MQKGVNMGHAQNHKVSKTFHFVKNMFWLSYECFSILRDVFFLAKKGYFQA